MPSSIADLIALYRGSNRRMWAASTGVPVCSAAATICFAAGTSWVKGFSTATGMPASSAANAGGACRCSGVHTISPSTPLRSPTSVDHRAPTWPAASRARSASASQISATLARGCSATARSHRLPMTPAPAMANRTEAVTTSLPSRVRPVRDAVGSIQRRPGLSQALVREMAGDLAAWPPLAQCWFLGPADVLGHRAARVEPAPRWRVLRIRRIAADFDPGPATMFNAWHRVHQGAGVGVRRGLIDICGACEFDDLTEVHDGDPITDVTHHADIVRDEQHCEAEVPFETPEQVEDLCLYRDI